MILPGKQNPCSTWAVGVEVGVSSSAFPDYLILCCARIMEVARDFPHCQAVAVDLVPMQSMQVASYSFLQCTILTTYLLVICLKTAGNVSLHSHPQSVTIFSIIGVR